MKTKFLIPLIAGLGLLWACKGKNSGSNADNSYNVAAKEKSANKSIDSGESGDKLIKTADMNFKVKNVLQTSERIAALTTSLNGAVIHHNISSTPGASSDIHKTDDSLMRITIMNTTAEMTVKIPSVNVENFLNQVAHLGVFINNSRMDISDKSFDYLTTRLKLKNQNDLVDQQKKETTNKKDPESLLTFKNNMVDQQIVNRKIDDSVKNSIIKLSFYESNVINREIIANDDLSAYNPPLFRRLSIAIENGWDAFVSILVILANFWILIPVGLSGWFSIKYYKKKTLFKG